ncbi:MAG: MBL fold metallo-hydrolase [Myxococcota bacterium]
MSKRRPWFVGGAALAVAGLWAACGSEPKPSEATPKKPQPTEVASKTDSPKPTAQAHAPGPVVTPSLVVLGIAQDAGVPQTDCDCERCRAAAEDPMHRPRVSSLALMLDDGRSVLFDATPDLPAQLRHVAALRGERPGARGRRPVAGIFLTHGHMGHYLGLAHLGFESAHTDRVPVHGTERMLALLRDHAPWSQLVAKQEIELNELRDGQAVTLGVVDVVPVLVPHRAEFTDTLAFRFEGPERTVLFIPDCDPWSRWEPAALDALLDGVDVALLDGTFYSGDELPGRDLTKIGHPLMVDTMQWLSEQPDAPQVRFIHLNHSNPALTDGSAARQAIERRGFAVARRGEALAL